MVKRFEEGKSHHQARSKLQEAETIIAQKDAEIEKLNAQVSLRTPPCATAPMRPAGMTPSIAQVLALQRSIEHAHDSLGSVPDAPSQAPGSSEA